MSREPLPNRRRCETFGFDHRNPDGSVFHFIASVGFYDDGRPGEVFLATTKIGSTLDIGIKDSAIALSLALQYGADLSVLAPTFLRREDGTPEGPLGTLVDKLVEFMRPVPFRRPSPLFVATSEVPA